MRDEKELASQFHWHCHDVRNMLPESWNVKLLDVANSHSIKRLINPSSVTSRESDSITKILIETVGGTLLAQEAAWLDALYRGEFRQLVELRFSQPIYCATDTQIGINLNIQRGGNRYEAHVDSNPIQGLLYVTSHPEGSGGELAVSNKEGSRGVEEIDANCSIIYPQSGMLLLFDARRNAHYVRELASKEDVRVVVAMNFYTVDSPESNRPTDLTPHLFGASIDSTPIDKGVSHT